MRNLMTGVRKRHGLNAEICELISCHGRFIENPSRKQALLWLADLCVNRDGDYIGYQKRYESIKERYKNDPERLFQVYRILEYLQIHLNGLCLLWIPKDKLPYYV